jgi:hypothetical protein
MGNSAIAHSRFIEDPSLPSTVIDWFRRQELVPEESAFDWGVVLAYRTSGPLWHKPDRSIDAERSPLVAVHLPKVRRQVLWTVGEVTFRPRPLSQFPKLATLRQSFLRWFDDYPTVYGHSSSGVHKYDYYLEAGAQNSGPIKGFPSGMKAIAAERYFISHRATDGALEQLRKKLQLRSVYCAERD